MRRRKVQKYKIAQEVLGRLLEAQTFWPVDLFLDEETWESKYHELVGSIVYQKNKIDAILEAEKQ